jgi:superfamily I DNA and RNA helicase
MAHLREDNKYTLNVDIQIDNALQQLRTIRKKVKEVVKECNYKLNKLSLKRKDILVVRLNCMLKQNDIEQIEKRLKKKLHRKVLVINRDIELETIKR